MPPSKDRLQQSLCCHLPLALQVIPAFEEAVAGMQVSARPWQTPVLRACEG
jgi:hypothetical protein